MMAKRPMMLLLIFAFLALSAASAFAEETQATVSGNAPNTVAAAMPATEQTVISDADMSVHNDAWGFTHKDGVVLALSGGGTKGLAHIGVMEVLEREHIPVAAIVGTSMGSIVGGLFATGWTGKEARETLPQMNLIEVISGRKGRSLAFESTSYPPKNNERLMNLNISSKGEMGSFKSLLNSKNLYTLLTELTSRVSETDFDKFPIPYAAIATDLSTGETVRLRSGTLASAMRASMAFPGIFEPWEKDGRLLVDGGLKANLPVIEAKRMFPGHPVIAVNLSPQELNMPKEKVKSAVNVVAQTVDILMHQQTVENCKAADVVIQVDCTGLGILDATGYEDIMDRGVKAAEEKLGDIKTVMDRYHAHIPPEKHTGPEPNQKIYVKEVVIEGVPRNLRHSIQAKYQGWVDKPLDMAQISDAVSTLSQRSEIKSIEPKINNLSRDTVRITLDVEPQPKYEFSFSGYSTNLNPDRWASFAALRHGLLMDGDSADIEVRLGNYSGAIARYFTALNSHNMQFGITGSVMQEKNYYNSSNFYYGPDDQYSYRSDELYSRYSGKAMIYKNFANNKVRIGVGYAIGKTNQDETYTYPDGSSYTLYDYLHKGVAATIGINSLDDPIVPTKGFALMSDMWLPHGESLFSRTEFTAKLPLKSNWLISLTGGLNTAALPNKNSDKPSLMPYVAWLGTRNELWSLASDPMYGEQAYWAKLSATKVLMRSWWGGINTEFFASYGRTTLSWNEESGHAWEVGVQLGIPTNFLPGSIILAYGQSRSNPNVADGYFSTIRPDRNEFIIGYTIGIPKWWKGPLP